MLKLIITEAVVSKGYNDDPAVRYFSSNSENTGQVANFRIGKRVYDSKAENNHRWLNFTVKAFGDMCERVKRMKLKEGSYINIIARYDEEAWEIKDTHETRTGVVLYLDEIEYASSGNGQKNGQASSGGTAPQGSNAPAAQNGAPAAQNQQSQGYPQGQPPAQGQPASDPMPGGFTGYEGFGNSCNPFF